MMLNGNWLSVVLLTNLIVCASGGCSSKGNDASSKEHSHVRVLTMLYTRAASKLGRPPRDEEEFKQTLLNLQIPLEPLQVDSVDELFASERDKLQLVISYGPLRKNTDVIIHESAGVDGKRLVGHRSGMIEEIDEVAWQSLTSTEK